LIYGKVRGNPEEESGDQAFWDIHYTADSPRFRADKLLIISHRILAFWQQTTDGFHHQKCCECPSSFAADFEWKYIVGGKFK